MSQANESITSIKLVAFNHLAKQNKEKLALNLIYELESALSMPDTLSKALKVRDLNSAIKQFVKDHPPRIAS